MSCTIYSLRQLQFNTSRHLQEKYLYKECQIISLSSQGVYGMKSKEVLEILQLQMTI